jgi:hypothetical protein
MYQRLTKIRPGNLNETGSTYNRYGNPRGYPGLGGFKNKHPEHKLDRPTDKDGLVRKGGKNA